MKVLVANRGAVAARILRALKALDMESVAVYSDADAALPYLQEADQAVNIGAASARDSYLNQEALLRTALAHDCAAVHPGYGFLAENAQFAERVRAAGLAFIGPSPRWISLLGDKIRARQYLQPFGMPMLPSSGELYAQNDLAAAVDQLGLPVLLKPSGGGGGIGMVPIREAAEIPAAWQRAKSLSEKAFSTSGLYIEKLAVRPRHIEFQLLADRYGNVRCLFERDCSIQRRHQKVIEESPAPNVPPEQLTAIIAELERIMGAIAYDVIGTVEMLYDANTGFQFLEVNTRLQVEHAVTEEITGIDIVAAQIRLALGERLDEVLPARIACNGHAIEARIYAEDPVSFFPSCGVLSEFAFAADAGIRVETGYGPGNRVTAYYDPMLAKVIAHAANRDACIDRLEQALVQSRITGVKTNIPFVLQTLASRDFRLAEHSTDNH